MLALSCPLLLGAQAPAASRGRPRRRTRVPSLPKQRQQDALDAAAWLGALAAPLVLAPPALAAAAPGGQLAAPLADAIADPSLQQPLVMAGLGVLAVLAAADAARKANRELVWVGAVQVPAGSWEAKQATGAAAAASRTAGMKQGKQAGEGLVWMGAQLARPGSTRATALAATCAAQTAADTSALLADAVTQARELHARAAQLRAAMDEVSAELAQVSEKRCLMQQRLALAEETMARARAAQRAAAEAVAAVSAAATPLLEAADVPDAGPEAAAAVAAMAMAVAEASQGQEEPSSAAHAAVSADHAGGSNGAAHAAADASPAAAAAASSSSNGNGSHAPPSPAAAKWDHSSRVMPAGAPPPVTPKMGAAAAPAEAQQEAQPAGQPAAQQANGMGAAVAGAASEPAPLAVDATAAQAAEEAPGAAAPVAQAPTAAPAAAPAATRSRGSSPAASSSSALSSAKPAAAVWTDPVFAAQTLAKFQDARVATAEEARVLIEKGGYTYLDVRPTIQLEEAGRVRRGVNVPFVQVERVYKRETGAKVLEAWPNEYFLEQVLWQFPSRDALIVLSCSDGKTLTPQALEQLEGAGYARVVVLEGGFAAWTQVFDSKGHRRRA